MRADWWVLATLWLLSSVCQTESISTCKSLDVELVRRKRIEAIRGQILSKLRLDKEPSEEGDRQEIPVAIMSTYNSTVAYSEELVQQDTLSADPEEEEYFAKEVHKFIMKTPPSATNQSDFNVVFNMSEIRASVENEQLVSSAELRLLIKKPSMRPNDDQRLELYDGLGQHARYLSFRFITSRMNDHWLSFDVTQSLREWLQRPEEEQGLQLKVHCDCWKKPISAHFSISGLQNDMLRGDMKSLVPIFSQKPHLLVMSHPANIHNLRKKRATGTDQFCTDKETDTCCVRRLYIDFRKDLGWKWIHEPSGYYANYCMGSCTYIWNTENKYSQILALYKHHNPGASAQPCCVPQALEPLPILYYVGRQYKVEQLSNMIVKTCKCS